MKKTLAILLSCVWLGSLAGCQAIKNAITPSVGSIKTPSASVVGVKDAGKPATIDSTNTGEVLEIPKGTTVIVTRTEAVPATEKTPYLPAVERFEYKFDSPTVWKRNDAKVTASTGTTDTTIATKRIEAEESRVLLYAAIAAMVGVGIFMWLQYPTAAFICGGASVVFFLAWKVSGLPDWFYVIGAIGLAAAAFLYLGHERGQKSNTSTK